MGFMNAPGGASISTLTWDTNMIIPSGYTINSSDTTGTVGANLKNQLMNLLGGAL